MRETSGWQLGPKEDIPKNYSYGVKSYGLRSKRGQTNCICHQVLGL